MSIRTRLLAIVKAAASVCNVRNVKAEPAPRVIVETPCVSYEEDLALTDYQIVKYWQQVEGLSYRKIMAKTGLSYRQVSKHCRAD